MLLLGVSATELDAVPLREFQLFVEGFLQVSHCCTEVALIETSRERDVTLEVLAFLLNLSWYDLSLREETHGACRAIGEEDRLPHDLLRIIVGIVGEA